MARKTYSRLGCTSLHSLLYKITFLALVAFLASACKEKSVPVIENPKDGDSKYLVSTFDSNIPIGSSSVYAFAISVDSLSKKSIVFSGKANNGSSPISLTNMTFLEGAGATISIDISTATNFPTSYIVKSANDGPIYQVKLSDINLTTNKIKYQIFDVKNKKEIQTPGFQNIDVETSQRLSKIQRLLRQNNYNARIGSIDCQKLDILTTGALSYACLVSVIFSETGVGAVGAFLSCDAAKDRIIDEYGVDGKCSDWAKRNAQDADCISQSIQYALDLDGGTPLPCCQRQGCKPAPPAQSTGDPHLMTLDGIIYDFQGKGEFVATKSKTDNFEIQVRQDDVNKNGHVTMNTGIAIQTGSDVVCITVKPYRVYVNKQLRDLANLTGLSLKDGASITKIKEKGIDVIIISHKNGDRVKVVFQSADYLDYYLNLSANRKNQVMGLLGNYDDDKNNDIQIRNGENILNNGTLAFGKLYPGYADSWRITQSNSLFFYEPGKNTDSYTEKDFPRNIQTLTSDQKIKAEATCRAAGVTSEPFLSNCIVDVAITNNPDMANSSLWGQQENKFPASKPIPVVIEEIEVKRIVSMLTSCFILKSDETLWVSGLNSNGQFGIGQPVTYTTNNKFVKIMDGVKDIAAGIDGAHMLFLKKDGLWAAGDNRYGEIGNGLSGNERVLAAVKIMSDAKAMAIAGYSSYVVRNDGTLWTFGVNNYGQLGDGTKVSRYTPVKVMGDVKAISAAGEHALALKTDNSLWGFGGNHFGALGISKDQYPIVLSPTKLMDDVKTMTAGQRYSMVVKNNKELWVSGDNYAGQLGSGNYNDLSAFKKTMDNVADATTSYEWSLILQGNNSLWSTGRNLTGSLGLSSTSAAYSTPVQSMSDVKYVVTGYGGTFIVKTDKSLWAVGSNTYGQLGLGSTGGGLNFSKVTVK